MKNGEYELIIPPRNYPGKRYRGRYAYEHHVVWWQITGEIIKEGYTIHHRNERKRDNRPENLEKMTKEDHDKHHADEKKRTMIPLVCSFCGDTFERDIRQVRSKKKNGQKDFYCGRSCMAKHFGKGRSKIGRVAER